MAKRSGILRGIVLNLSVVVLGLAAITLLYAFVARSFLPHEEAEAAKPRAADGDILQIEVRNGCGVSGLAAAATTFLRQAGYDVVEVGDHSRFDIEKSMVVDRVGDLEAAREIAATLGMPIEQVGQEIRADLYLDASVILGRDYQQLKPFQEVR